MNILSRIRNQGLRVVGFAAIVAALGLASPRSADAEFLTGLVSGPGVANGLVFFDSASTGTVSAPLAIGGLSSGESLIGIDYRPTTGLLYSVSNLNRVYTINTSSGLATLAGTLSVPLSGTFFGFDFNPVADLSGAASLRIISNTNQNLAVNVNPGSVGVTAAQTPITGAGGTNVNIVGSAYSNNDSDPATGTTLFGIDSLNNTLVSTAAPAGGIYTTLDPLGVDASLFVGFDVSGITGTAYAAIIADGTDFPVLYTVNLANTTLGVNRATGLGTIALANGFTLNGLAANVTVVPEPSSVVLVGLGMAGLAGFARRRRPVGTA